MDGWIETVSFLPIPKMDEKCLLDFFHSQHGCKLSGFCIFQPDHVPDPWMNTVCFASSNATMLPTVDENCPFFFIQPDHLGRPPQQLQQPLARSLARSLPSFLSGGGKALGIRKGGFWNRDSGIQKEREIDAAGGFVFVFPQELLESSLITSNHSLLQTETKRRRIKKQQQQKKKKKKKKENKK
jgi:hypothetical protein